MKIDHLTHTSLDDCRSGIAHASLAQLREAHRWADGRPGHSSRAKILAAAIKRLELNAGLDPAKGLPDDLTLLKRAHPNDIPRIASAAPLPALQAAAAWAIRALPGTSERRKAIEAEVAKRKGGRP